MNTAEKQTDVDKAASALTEAAEGLEYLISTNLDEAQTLVESIQTLYTLTADLKEADYSAGWDELQAARNAAYEYYTQHKTITETDGRSVYTKLSELYQTFYDAYYYGLKNSAESISISVRTADNMALKETKYSSTQWQLYQSSELTYNEPRN